MGVMTMMLSLMVRVLVIQIQKWMDYNARIEETVTNILALRSQVVPAQSQANAANAKKAGERIEKLKAEAEEEIAAA
jgi:hypothetical protein